MRVIRIFILVLITVFSSCGYDNLVVDKPECLVDASYDINVKDIIQSSCAYHVECHGQSSAYGDYTTYEKMRPILNPQKFTDRVLVTRNMPPDYASELGGPVVLPDEQLEILRCWAEANFPK